MKATMNMDELHQPRDLAFKVPNSFKLLFATPVLAYGSHIEYRRYPLFLNLALVLQSSRGASLLLHRHRVFRIEH